VVPKCLEEVLWVARLDVDIKGLEEALAVYLQVEDASDIGHDPRWLVDLGEQVHLEIRGERVRQAHVAWEGREDQVPHLDARRGDDITETEVVFTEELGEVMEEDEEDPEGALVQQPDCLGQLRLP
jgi:hypothetical protein